jgi:hypothetical protein
MPNKLFIINYFLHGIPLLGIDCWDSWDCEIKSKINPGSKMIQKQICRKRNFDSAMSTNAEEVYNWIGTILSSQTTAFVDKLKEKGIQMRSSMRMNANHFIRMGLDEERAHALVIALKSPPDECMMSNEREDVQLRTRTDNSGASNISKFEY